MGEFIDENQTAQTGNPVIDRVAEGVVRVEGSQSGTGFIFDTRDTTRGTEALILTASHLVEGEGSISVYVEEEEFSARVVNAHETLDATVLSICCSEFTDLPMAASFFTDTGGWVVSVARPDGELEFSAGRVKGHKTYSDGSVIFHDTTGRAGYSGAPILVGGRVVGMTVGESTEQGYEGLAMSLGYETLEEVIR